VLRRVSVEAVSGQRLTSRKQLEAFRGNDKVQVTRLAAHGAIALRDLQLRWRDHLESDTTTVTTPSVCDRAFSCRLTFNHFPKTNEYLTPVYPCGISSAKSRLFGALCAHLLLDRLRAEVRVSDFSRGKTRHGCRRHLTSSRRQFNIQPSRGKAQTPRPAPNRSKTRRLASKLCFT